MPTETGAQLAKERAKAKREALERELMYQFRAVGLKPIPQYRFCAVSTGGAGPGVRYRLNEAGLKDWRADYAFPDQKLLVEIEGGGWTGGRHTRGGGFAEDLAKYDAAARLGWRLYRCDGRMVKSGQALQTIQTLLTQASDTSSV